MTKSKNLFYTKGTYFTQTNAVNPSYNRDELLSMYVHKVAKSYDKEELRKRITNSQLRDITASTSRNEGKKKKKQKENDESSRLSIVTGRSRRKRMRFYVRVATLGI